MRKNAYYILSAIGDAFYLVPFGQAIEEHAHTVFVSEVAAFIWNEMDAHQDVKALAERIAEEYELMPEDADSLEEDVKELFRGFMKEGIVFEEKGTLLFGSEPFGANREADQDADFNAQEVTEMGMGVIPIQTMRIAGITIRFFGDGKYFSDNFMLFCVETQKFGGTVENDINVYVTEDAPPETGGIPTVLRGMDVELYDGGDFYVMRSIDTPEMKEGHFRKDGSKAVLHMDLFQPGSCGCCSRHGHRSATGNSHHHSGEGRLHASRMSGSCADSACAYTPGGSANH